MLSMQRTRSFAVQMFIQSRVTETMKWLCSGSSHMTACSAGSTSGLCRNPSITVLMNLLPRRNLVVSGGTAGRDPPLAGAGNRYGLSTPGRSRRQELRIMIATHSNSGPSSENPDGPQWWNILYPNSTTWVKRDPIAVKTRAMPGLTKSTSRRMWKSSPMRTWPFGELCQRSTISSLRLASTSNTALLRAPGASVCPTSTSAPCLWQAWRSEVTSMCANIPRTEAAGQDCIMRQIRLPATPPLSRPGDAVMVCRKSALARGNASMRCPISDCHWVMSSRREWCARK
mmetsp:Transcript_3635/g.8698  ORF Transcript_3635/g.8698 Transcript_3635/m.8698 type:complete len:286 (+) Transcript_3635:786-1643(+)